MHVLIVEDEAKLARALAEGLREEGFAVTVALDGAEGWFLAREATYDLVILDVLLPEMDGFSLLAALRGTGGATRVLLLTARDAVEDRVRGLELGADDYLVKPFHFAELLARARALLRRGRKLTGDELRVGDLRLCQRRRQVWRGGRELSLRPKEFGILEYLLRHPGRVISRTELSEHVWDESFNETMSNLIDVTVYNLRRVVDQDAEERLIRTVRGVGYVIGGPG